MGGEGVRRPVVEFDDDVAIATINGTRYSYELLTALGDNGIRTGEWLKIERDGRGALIFHWAGGVKPDESADPS